MVEGSAVKRLGVMVAVLTVAALATWWLTGESAVRQPVAFPHKAHLDLKSPKFECTTCHDRAQTTAVAGRPSTKKCLSCHSGAEAKSAEEKKLQAFGEKGGEVPWQRVWRLPSHVFFSHRTHVGVAKVRCQTCHGPMETLTQPPARPLKALAMSDCIDCHEQWPPPPPATGTDGQAAEPVPAVPPTVKVARRPVSTDCNTCHR